MSNYSAITIDFWSTLVNPEIGGEERHKSRLKAMQELADKYGKVVNEAAVEAAKQKVADYFNEVWLNDHRTPLPFEIAQKLMQELGVDATRDELTNLGSAIENSLLDGPPGLTEGAAEVIPKLAESATLVIISDTMYSPGSVLREHLNRKGIGEYFDGFIFSDEMGFSKPDKRAFQKALEIAGSEAARGIHIGDLEHTDIIGAKGVGMDAILYTGVSKSGPVETKADHICTSWFEIAEIIG